MPNFLSLLDKCRGAMILTAIGDALGWPNEDRSGNTSKKNMGQDKFVSWQRRTGGRFYNHVETIFAGEYSDDTQMVLAVARSIIAGNWENFFIKRELPFWSKYERGGGTSLLRAAKFYKTAKKNIWQSEFADEYYQAGGNGAAMRILPHIIAAGERANNNELLSEILRDCLITHGHPRALLGATCYAYALNWLLNKNTVLEYGELVSAVKEGKNIWGLFPEKVLSEEWLDRANHIYNYRETWNKTLSEMIKQLDYIDNSLQKGLMIEDVDVLTNLHCFEMEKGAGDIAILTAIYFASKYANNPILGIKIPALMSGIDSDTIASITGGLLGMISGLEQIPEEWRIVQDYSCLIHITELLASGTRTEDLKSFILIEKKNEPKWESSPIGLIHFLRSQTVQCGKKSSVDISVWKTIFGQTLYIKNYHQFRNNEIECKHQTINTCKDNSLEEAVKNYFIKLGLEYAFLGEKFVITDNNRRYIIDLLFFNRTLSCLVAVQIKIGSFFDEVIKQMQTYLKLLDNKLKKEKENPSMGIIVNINQGKSKIEIIPGENFLPIMAIEYASKLLDKNDLERYLNERYKDDYGYSL